MHEVNLLGKYIPEFGKLTCLVQHEFYHQYAADEHTLVCLEQLDRIWEAKTLPYKNYAPLFQNLERPGVALPRACCCTTSARRNATNEATTPRSAPKWRCASAKRLRLDGTAAHTLRVIIENHLLMASVSQRRDLDDPAVIRNFAREIETPETLDLLTLLTFADSQGTSDKLWNGFKDSLLWQLHTRAMMLLTGGTEFIRAEAEQREALVAGSPPTRRQIERRGTGRAFCHAAAALFSDPHRPGNPRRPGTRAPFHAPARDRG